MPNQLSMASNCPGEMVVRMRYVLTTPDWFQNFKFLSVFKFLENLYLVSKYFRPRITESRATGVLSFLQVLQCLHTKMQIQLRFFFFS